ncbi:hypothetical protein ACI79D_05770 [Geodermatophilus sp. SYSU D00708]
MLDYLVVGGLLTVIAFCLFILTRIQPEQPARVQHRAAGDGGTTLMPAQVAPSPALAPRPPAARSHRGTARG